MSHLIKQHRAVGFFSSFNIIVAALKFVYDNKIDNFFVDWKNSLYQTDEKNLFDTYFYKQSPPNKIDYIHNATEMGYIYTSIFDRALLLELNNILKVYGHMDNNIYKKCKDDCIKIENCLGVHVRGTDHWQHGPLLNAEYYFKKIDEKLNLESYKNILLITDENKNIEIFKNKYGDIIHTNNNIFRSSNETAIHYSNFSNLDKLVQDVMIDAISLSMCDEILVTSSNVSAYTLMLNPTIKFEQIDLHIQYH